MSGDSAPHSRAPGGGPALAWALANLSRAADAYGSTWRARLVAVLHLMTTLVLALLYLLPAVLLLSALTWAVLLITPHPPSVPQTPAPGRPALDVLLLAAALCAAGPLARLSCRIQRDRLRSVFGFVEADPADPADTGSPAARLWRSLFGGRAWVRVARSTAAGAYALLAGALVVVLVVCAGAAALGALLGFAYILASGAPGDPAETALLMAAGPVASLLGLRLAPYLVAGEVALHRALHLEAPEVRMRRRLLHVQDSRLRMVDAAESERRRIERDLHDGAQQRLLALSMTLTRARTRLSSDPDGALELVDRARRESGEAMEELRRIARGLHPRVLTDHGLPSALPVAAGRCPVPVEIDADLEQRPSRRAEAVAYYVVCEALTNAARHAGAGHVRVRALRLERPRGGDLLRVTVTDDGEGGADPEVGTGLYGLWDRVDAVDGTLTVHSPAGAGTALTADIPWEA
ncbi:sensor histidine kinase [Nocardiopsis sp. LOL_012]|uniref:sensor histidine kinase n=1 Tax=Nocardiopsis sp. LOL_012 TaxID=3345409 RepID=UPI003A88B92D